MSAQTEYGINIPVGYAGLIYAQAPSDIVSRLVETSDGIPFGVAVSRGTDTERQIELGGTDFLGITIRSLEEEGAANTGDIQWEESVSAGVMRNGYIWAVSVDGCTAGDSVNYVDADGTFGTGTAGAGETQLDGASWETTASAGDLAVIRLETSETTAGS
jgi:hypothetical protein